MSHDPLTTESASQFLARVHDGLSAPPSAAESKSSLEHLQRRWLELGIRPGDVIVLSLPNGALLLNQFFGVLLAGAVPVLLPPTCPGQRLRELASLLAARAIVGSRLLASRLASSTLEPLAASFAAVLPTEEPPRTQPGEVILLTSGTSGFLSGCVFALEDLLLNAERHADSIGQSDRDTVLVNLPLHYSFALVAQALATFQRGGRLVVDGPPFTISSYSTVLSQSGATISSLTPSLARMLLACDGLIARQPRVLTVGGDCFGGDEVARLLTLRGDRELYITYGLTQAGPRVSTLAAHNEPESRFASVGRPISGTSVFAKPISNGSELKQLFVSSQTVMRRHIGIVEGRATEDVSQGRSFASRTVATGDIFEQDAHGYLYFRGRLSEFIIKNGEKLCLAAVRRIALQLPGVIHAKTQALAAADGGQDYDMLLFVSTPAHDYETLLQRQLRKTEMPRRIVTNLTDSQMVLPHK